MKTTPEDDTPIESQSANLKELHKLYLEAIQKAVETKGETKPKFTETTNVQVVKAHHESKSDIHPPPNMPGGTQERFKTTHLRIQPEEFDEDDETYIRKKNYEELEEQGRIHQSYLDALVSAYRHVQPIEEIQRNTPKTILNEFKRSGEAVGPIRQARNREPRKGNEEEKIEVLFRTRRSTPEDDERKINFEKQKLHTRVNRGWNRHHTFKQNPETQEFYEVIERPVEEQPKKEVNRNRGHVIFRPEDHSDELFYFTSTMKPHEMVS